MLNGLITHLTEARIITLCNGDYYIMGREPQPDPATIGEAHQGSAHHSSRLPARAPPQARRASYTGHRPIRHEGLYVQPIQPGARPALQDLPSGGKHLYQRPDLRAP